MALTEQLFLIGLCVCSKVYSLPLPRFAYPTEANPSTYWEVRPASDPSYATITADTVQYASYLGGRFDPNRPYIQMIVPNENQMALAEKKPLDPLVGPTKPTLDDHVNTLPISKEIETSCGNVSEPFNTTNSVNETDAISNLTNRTEYCNKTITAPVLLMLADGMTLYAVGGEQDSKPSPSLSGTYELAYVARRPTYQSSVRPQFYPLVHYHDHYNPFLRGGFGWPSLAGSPLYTTPGLYQPVYVYRPVFPTPSRSYDVYYYLPVDAQNQQNVKENEKTKPTTVVKEQMKTQNGNEDVSANGYEDVSQAKETAMTDSLEELNPEEQALVDALKDKTGEKKLPEEGDKVDIAAENTEIQDDVTTQWDEELNEINDKELMESVERVLEQLHQRLIAN